MDSKSEGLRQRKATEITESSSNPPPSQPQTIQGNTRSKWIPSFEFVVIMSFTIGTIFAIRNLEWVSLTRANLFTKEQLSAFDGSNGSRTYIAILGEVYDVSEGEKYYGEGKGYHCFVAKDASRSFVTGNFVADLIDDVSDFNAEKCGILVEWRQFFRDHETYSFVGKVIGAFFNERGEATETLKKVEDGANRAEEIKALKNEAKKQNPNCNSKWAQGKDGEVWCEIGYPRLVVEFFPGAAERKRCACFKEMDHSDQKQLYENCAPDANKCIIPPKAEETKKTDAKI